MQVAEYPDASCVKDIYLCSPVEWHVMQVPYSSFICRFGKLAGDYASGGRLKHHRCVCRFSGQLYKLVTKL